MPEQQPAASSGQITSMINHGGSGQGGAPTGSAGVYGTNAGNMAVISEAGMDENMKVAINEGHFFKLLGEINIYNLLQEVNMWAGKGPGGLGEKIFGTKIGLLASIFKKPAQEVGTPTAPTTPAIAQSQSAGIE
jgi:hypothetical protein